MLVFGSTGKLGRQVVLQVTTSQDLPNLRCLSVPCTCRIIYPVSCLRVDRWQVAAVMCMELDLGAAKTSVTHCCERCDNICSCLCSWWRGDAQWWRQPEMHPRRRRSSESLARVKAPVWDLARCGQTPAPRYGQRVHPSTTCTSILVQGSKASVITSNPKPKTKPWLAGQVHVDPLYLQKHPCCSPSSKGSVHFCGKVVGAPAVVLTQG